MAWLSTEISDRQKAELLELIERYGRWLRRYEPAPTVYEDLLCHRLRSVLVGLLEAVEHLDRRAARRCQRQLVEVQYKLVLTRATRGVDA